MPTSEEELKRIKEQRLKATRKKKKSKSEKKKAQAEYKAAKARLEKAQAKYVQKPKKEQSVSQAENKKWEQKRIQRYNERVWRGWRESEGKEAPVTTYKLEDLEKGK